MTDRTKTIGVRVTPDEHEKFTSYVEESNEFDSLSRFLRVIAYRHIAEEKEEDDASMDPEEIVNAVDTAVAPIADKLDTLQDHVLAIDANVGGDDDVDKLARELYLSLPTHRDASELPSLRGINDIADTNDLSMVQSFSTPYLWAQYFDVDLGEMRRACARMLEYYPDVEFVDENVDSTQGSVPTHDNVHIPESSSDDRTVDITHDHKTGTTRSNTPQRDRDSERVRRYFKTEEA